MHFSKLAAVTMVIAACSAPAQNTRQDASPSVAAANQTAPSTYATTPVMTPAPAPAAAAPARPPTKNQPPHIKLKLGHYTDGAIGLVIDGTHATDSIADIDPVKVRFDGDNKVYVLQGQHGPRGRIDYLREGGKVLLHAWDDGRRSVYVPDPDTDRSSDEIRLWRDADADPL